MGYRDNVAQERGKSNRSTTSGAGSTMTGLPVAAIISKDKFSGAAVMAFEI